MITPSRNYLIPVESSTRAIVDHNEDRIVAYPGLQLAKCNSALYLPLASDVKSMRTFRNYSETVLIMNYVFVIWVTCYRAL